METCFLCSVFIYNTPLTKSKRELFCLLIFSINTHTRDFLPSSSTSLLSKFCNNTFNLRLVTLLANAALLSLSSVLILYIYNRMACPAAAVLVGSDIIDLRRMGRKGGGGSRKLGWKGSESLCNS